MGNDAMKEVVGRRTLGHLAVHYRTSEDGLAAVRLMRLLGFEQMPSPDHMAFYHFVVDPHADNSKGDGIIYLVELPGALRDLNHAVREALRVGQSDEHPAVAAARAGYASDPEFDTHLGVLFSSLEEIEAIVMRLQDAASNDPQLAGRINLVYNRSRPGSLDVDQRLDESPVFKNVSRLAYGRNGTQVFVETDLLVAGPLGDKFVLELDYVFPGHPVNILTDPADMKAPV